MNPAELVERIWARDPTAWTGEDEAHRLGWLDEPFRIPDGFPWVEDARVEFDSFVLLGMGGSSLAPEVFRRTFDSDAFHVLDTTHPRALRRLEASLDLARTLFIVSSKSGTTLETRCHLDYFWARAGGRGAQFVAITDPGSELEQVGRERGFRAVVAGEPTIGGRYSALSPFGVVPAALMGVELARLRARAQETAEACRGSDSPGLELGLGLGSGWEDGRDKVVIRPNPGGFGLWVEQLLAESTGKQGKGLVPAPNESPEGPDRQLAEVQIRDPYDLGAEFFRWEFATAVAGSILGINPFDQPDVQAAKDATNQVLAAGGEPDVEPRGSLEGLLEQARPGDYVAVQAFVDPAREGELVPLAERVRAETGCVVTLGLGPRYLHSTGQLHKGGPPSVLALQVVDDPGEELRIPGRKFGFARLIRAQAAGDYASLEQRGRRVARIRLEDV